MLAIALSVIPGGFAVDLVRDRTLKCKHQLLTAGTPVSVYFVAYFAMDMLLMLFPIAVALILAAATDVTPLIGPAFGATFLSMFLYVPLMILFCFYCARFYKDADAVQQFPMLVNLLGFMPFIAVAVAYLQGAADTAQTMHYLFCVFDPPYTLPLSLIHI